MSGDKKAACKALIETRDSIEREIDSLNKFLASPEVVSFVVVDDQGFPNSDAEMVIKVRKAQHRLAGLLTYIDIYHSSS